MDATNPEELDRLLLSTKPSQRAMRYSRMKCFGSNFRVDDEGGDRFQMYNSGVAFVFEVPSTDARDVSVNYVGVLKDILKLDYGPLHTPIILFRCQWVKTTDNRGNRTYVRDDAGFLIVNYLAQVATHGGAFHFCKSGNTSFLLGCSFQTGLESCLAERDTSKERGSRLIRRFYKHHS